MTRARFAAAALALTGVAPLAAGCKSKKETTVVVFDARPASESAADVEAKDVLKVLGTMYPAVCDSTAATRSWLACRDSEKGYGLVFRCAENSLSAARGALAGLKPTTTEHGACGEEIKKASLELLNTAPNLFSDIMKWLEVHHAKLTAALVMDTLGDACRKTKELCADEPHDWQDQYRPMRLSKVDSIECTNKLLRCGEKPEAECWPRAIAPRLGIACPPAQNRTGTGPDDLLWVRETGTPLAR
jgi:hypothetical protein